MAFPGFTKRHKGTISNGDFDRDGVINRKDCEPLNFRKQDGGKIGIGDIGYAGPVDDMVIIKGEEGDNWIVDNNVNEYKIKKSKVRRDM